MPNGGSAAVQNRVRAKNESTWRMFKDKLQDRFYAFDTTAFPDGEYVLRVTASDAPGNTEAQALTSSLESDPFTIDNTPPEISKRQSCSGRFPAQHHFHRERRIELDR